MGMNLCSMCLFGKDVEMSKSDGSIMKTNCDWCGAFRDCFYDTDETRESFKSKTKHNKPDHLSLKRGLIALKISKTSKTPSEQIDKKLLDRAMELHREIKKLSAERLKLQQERLVLLEENRHLRIKLDELEEKDRGPYQDH